MKPLALLLTTLGVTMVGGAPLASQTAAQNDSVIRAAARTSSLPLMTPRKLSFTTDEASWISLDVSPDGRTIVFGNLGDLYTLPMG